MMFYPDFRITQGAEINCNRGQILPCNSQYRSMKMSTLKRLAIFVLFLAISNPVCLYPEVANKIVDTVNSESILFSDYEKVFNPTVKQYRKSVSTKDLTNEKIKELKKVILDQMIDEKLIIQEAKKQKVPVAQHEIDDLKEKLPVDEGLKAEFLNGEVTRKEFENKIK